MARKRKSGASIVYVLLVILTFIFIAATAGVIWLSVRLADKPAPTQPSASVAIPTTPEQTEPTETTQPDPVPEHVVSTATVAAMGDLMMHLPVVNTALQSDGSYNFDSVFQYVKDYVSQADYAAINLETSLGGSDKPYSGFPKFNSPDAIVDGARDAGFDMMLTANNHSYDTGLDGFLRTLEVVRERGMETLGTMASAEEPKYVVKDINGIQIGMIAYTYETSNGQSGYPSLNGIAMTDGSYDLVNCFRYADLDAFYEEIAGYLADMKAEGAEATILYIHWGVEYLTYANDDQTEMAQKLCDLGFDVIVGGHPHVVEPMALLESTVDPEHKTVCIYSLGNAVSNQRKEYMDEYNPYGYTEDAALFSVTFEKYSDGTVYLADTNLIPTWVNMDTRSVKQYNILPLEDSRRDQWQSDFNLNSAMLSSAQKSYDRTMGLVGEGLESCKTWLAEQKQAREEYYYDLAWHPEKYAAVAARETIPETIPETTQETGDATQPAA